MNTINNKSAMKKSKTQICFALMKLLKTVPYRKITVSQVCALAGVSRTAFYKNFESLDAVVLYKLSQIEKDYNGHHSLDGDIRSRFTDFYSYIKFDQDKDYRNEPVWADRLKINKIALNLISNAIKFTHSGGTVMVTPYCSSSSNEKGTCSFIVEDTGLGMSEEFLKHMYEPFSQEKRSESVRMPGTGLGLSIVKKYVDLLGGTICVKSRLREGTRWEVTLPVTKLHGGPEEKPKEKNIEALQGRRILLLEDNIMNTEIASMLLKEKGLLVETAENGSLGLKKFTASPEGYYDMLLMDIRMPEMDGLEATRRIRALNRADAVTVPIIAMTADAFEESIQEAREAGMNAYITKPVEPMKMYETLLQCINDSGSTRA
ncbi:MAG: response regulator [Eubacteriaceae bacterium]|jgi:CheY-like chemotaxis protein|nr:response regulator [Eubacteriaceae bacterium]